MSAHLAALAALAMATAPLPRAGAASAPAPSRGEGSARHVIYLHGRIVQETQSPRPRHPRFGYYELERIRDAFRSRGFVVTADIRPRAASVSDSADRVVDEVRRLLGGGVSADHVTVVGASMGAAIALLAAARLQNQDLRLCTLGACAGVSVAGLLRDEGKAPAGHLLAVREASDDFTEPCPPWRAEGGSAPRLDVREIVLRTGLAHGFLYRPLPEWVDPVARWAAGGGRSE